MKSIHKQCHPATARFQYNNSYNYAIKLSANRAQISSHKKVVYDDAINSISPWAVEQFNSFKNSVQNTSECHKKNKFYDKLKKWRTTTKNSKNKYGINNQQDETIIIHIQDGQKIKQAKRRTKTETEMNCLSKIRLNTIEVSNNLQMKSNQKYLTQQCQDRKMSIHKFRSTLLETSRSKSINTNTNFFQTKNDIEKKVQQKMIGFSQLNQLKTGELVNRRLKTIQSENQSPLMFFFQAKNSKNMMARQKNIMKIRNLSKKNRRLKTGQA